MKNVFIALGGTGAKIAEVFVKQLTVGFPGFDQLNQTYHPANSFEIWRIDSDRDSASVLGLKKAIADYQKLRMLLSDDPEQGDGWFVNLDPEVTDLDPTEFTTADGTYVHAKTLRHVLDSRSVSAGSSSEILSAFFSREELDLNLEKGFAQQSSIGSAVMAVFGESLRDPNSPAGSKVRMQDYLNEPTRFFICGSTFGATGASGIVSMVRFLNLYRETHPGAKWIIGACAVTPFFSPPEPPFSSLPTGVAPDSAKVEEAIRTYGSSLSFAEMSPEDRSDSVRKILNGFIANPVELEATALRCLSYLNENLADSIDHLYLVGSDRQIGLPRWSVGGSTQVQPYTYTHSVSALSALSFFNRKEPRSRGRLNVPSSKNDYQSASVRSFDLPHYEVGDEIVQPERVLFSTALAVHLIKNRIPWGKMKEAGSVLKLARIYRKAGADIEAEYRVFREASDILRTCIWTLVDADSAENPTGWDISEWSNLEQILSDDPMVIKRYGESFERERFAGQAKGRVEHGASEAAFTDFDFAKWCPSEKEFSRANYLRSVWSGVFERLTN